MILAHLQGVDDCGQRGTLVLRPRERAGAGKGLDASHAGRDAGLGHDREEADVAGGAHVGAAAQLQAEAGDADDAHLVAILFAKQRHRAGRDRFLRRSHLGRDGGIAADLLVEAARRGA